MSNRWFNYSNWWSHCLFGSLIGLIGCLIDLIGGPVEILIGCLISGLIGIFSGLIYIISGIIGLLGPFSLIGGVFCNRWSNRCNLGCNWSNWCYN